jgi:hypothetical protein
VDTATIRREQTEKNATNDFEKSNYLNVLGFKHLVDIEGGQRLDLLLRKFPFLTGMLETGS